MAPVKVRFLSRDIGKYRYVCRFGDAMNTASRMESHGEEDRIHVGAATVALLETDHPDQFLFESRGLVEIKVLYTTAWFELTRRKNYHKILIFFSFRAKER